MQFNVTVKQTHSSTLTLAPAGSLDSDACKLLDAEFRKALARPAETLIIDMAEVSFITSAGVSLIAKAKAAAAQAGRDFAMINLQPQIQKVFEIMGLLPELNVFAGREELDEYLAKVQRRITGEEDY